MLREAGDRQYSVRAGHCDHRASEETVYETLRRITEPLERSWEKLEKAKQIAIKANIVWPPERLRCVDGRKQELVDEVVLRGVLRLLRERTTARIVMTDTYQEQDRRDLYFLPLLREFGVDYVECNHAPFAAYEVPGGGNMFTRYWLSPAYKESDAVVSVATLKSHAFMGVTLTTKNLFGLCPINHKENRPRMYFHHIIRLPYVLADLGACEYQRQASAAAAAAASPARPTAGQQVTFTGSATDGDPGELAAGSWAFGDGSTGAGLTAAHAYGLGTCYVASAAGIGAPEIIEQLQLPEGYFPVACVTVGYPSEMPSAAAPRRENDINYIL
jgi:nitroreductase